MKSILDIQVSCFANYDTPANPKNVNLLAWLKSTKFKDKVDHIRTIDDKAERDRLKAKLPGITPSGTFSYRSKRNLITRSGFMGIDIDYAGNEDMGNFTELKSQLCNIPNVAYCGLSVSGRGFWCLIPIAYPEKHEQHFRALQDAFKSLGITIDESCKDVSRLRGYSYDQDGYFNHSAKVFNIFKKPVKKQQLVRGNYKSDNHKQDRITIAVNMVNQSQDGEKLKILLKASALMGGYIASGEVDEQQAIYALETAIQNKVIDNFEVAQKAIIDGIEYGKKQPIYTVNQIPEYEPVLREPCQTNQQPDIKPDEQKAKDLKQKRIQFFEDADIIAAYLDTVKVGALIKLENIKHKILSDIVEVVKAVIDIGYFEHTRSEHVEFSSDYKHIRKISLPKISVPVSA